MTMNTCAMYLFYHNMLLRTECGEAFTGSSGDIYSQNWGNRNSCTWAIEVSAGNVIKAELVTFSIHPPSVYSVTVCYQYVFLKINYTSVIV